MQLEPEVELFAERGTSFHKMRNPVAAAADFAEVRALDPLKPLLKPLLKSLLNPKDPIDTLLNCKDPVETLLKSLLNCIAGGAAEAKRLRHVADPGHVPHGRGRLPRGGACRHPPTLQPNSTGVSVRFQ